MRKAYSTLGFGCRWSVKTSELEQSAASWAESGHFDDQTIRLCSTLNDKKYVYGSRYALYNYRVFRYARLSTLVSHADKKKPQFDWA